MKTRIIAINLLIGLAFAVPGHADHGCNGTIIEMDAGSGTLYLDDRSDGPGDINHWVYLESNGLEGLQSGGDNTIFEDTGPPLGLVPSFTDPCAHSWPDTLVV